jgi:endo-1,4-beta-xylanase
VSRYRGKIKTWHVVNEPIDDAKSGAPGLRPSVWLQHLGPRYIDIALRAARAADPAAELLINEYDVECVDINQSHKRQALQKLVRELRERGTPLDGIGLQGHLRGELQPDRDGLFGLASELRALRLSIHVTELDVIDDKLPGPPDLRDLMVAARAHDLLEPLFAAARPAAVACWGISDRYTWVPMYFKRKDGLANRPLPLDQDYRPKPLWQVIDYFCSRPA